jgi:hypothetical protein
MPSLLLENATWRASDRRLDQTAAAMGTCEHATKFGSAYVYGTCGGYQEIWAAPVMGLHAAASEFGWLTLL